MLTPAELANLTDTTVVSALRVKVETTTSGGRARASPGRPTTSSTPFVTRAAASATRGSPSPRRSATPGCSTGRDLPALTTVAPGESVSFDGAAHLPAVAPRGDDETTPAYLARLSELDDRVLAGAVFGSAESPVGTLLAPQETARARQRVGRVDVDLMLAPTATAGKQTYWDVKLTNRGAAPADAINAQLHVDGLGDVTLADVPDSLAPGASATAHAQLTLPTAGTVTAKAPPPGPRPEPRIVSAPRTTWRAPGDRGLRPSRSPSAASPAGSSTRPTTRPRSPRRRPTRPSSRRASRTSPSTRPRASSRARPAPAPARSRSPTCWWGRTRSRRAHSPPSRRSTTRAGGPEPRSRPCSAVSSGGRKAGPAEPVGGLGRRVRAGRRGRDPGVSGALDGAPTTTPFDACP